MNRPRRLRLASSASRPANKPIAAQGCGGITKTHTILPLSPMPKPEPLTNPLPRPRFGKRAGGRCPDADPFRACDPGCGAGAATRGRLWGREQQVVHPARVRPFNLNPKGVLIRSPGLRRSRYPGEATKEHGSTPTGLVHSRAMNNPCLGRDKAPHQTQGRRFAPTLGWRTQPLWGRSRSLGCDYGVLGSHFEPHQPRRRPCSGHGGWIR